MSLQHVLVATSCFHNAELLTFRSKIFILGYIKRLPSYVCCFHSLSKRLILQSTTNRCLSADVSIENSLRADVRLHNFSSTSQQFATLVNEMHDKMFKSSRCLTVLQRLDKNTDRGMCTF